MERCPTGIKGFDDLVEGGIPNHTSVLLLGAPGTGKTIFAMEFVYRGAVERGETGLYMSFEQNPDKLREQAKQLGFTELERLEQEGKIILMCIPVNEIDKDTVPDMVIKAKESGATRLVIDSLSALSINAPLYSTAGDMVMKTVMDKSTVISPPIIGEDVKKNFVYKFVNEIKGVPTTALLLGESHEQSSVSPDRIAEFVCDGVIVLKRTTIGEEINRTIHLEKMRLTNLKVAMRDFELTAEGFVVKGGDDGN